MKSALLAFCATFALATAAQASLLKMEASGKMDNGVAVAKSATASVDGKNLDLTMVGHGLRSKEVLFTKVKVYVAQLLVSSPNAFVHKDAEALRSLDDSQTTAIVMTFLRTVEANKVQVSFREAFMANKTNYNTPALKAFLAAVISGGDATSGNSLTILVNKNSDGSETLVYEDTTGKQTKITGEKGLTQQIFGIWLGTPSDDGIKALKTSLINTQE